MNAKEASELKEGQRVVWDGDKFDTGIICFHNHIGTKVWVKWDNVKSPGDWIDYEDMQKAEKASGYPVF